jgi:cysteine desulfurase
MTVYLDYAATSPLRDEVLDCYVEHLKNLGNPSSVHSSGQRIRRALEEARDKLHQLMNERVVDLDELLK